MDHRGRPLLSLIHNNFSERDEAGEINATGVSLLAICQLHIEPLGYLLGR